VRVIWLPEAKRSRNSQLRYIGERNPHAAIRLGDAIEEAVAGLGVFSHKGRPGRLAGTRELVVQGSPYVVIYRVEADAVVILRVVHGRQAWPPLR
jgi:toxin ParE1/3/4